MKAQAPKSKLQVPTRDEEMALLRQGYCFIAGLDEAGRGCLAGPVVAAAVILPTTDDHLACFAGVRDSKQLSPYVREQLYEVIMQYAVAVGVGIGSVELIDERNILQATKYAMRCAFDQLSPSPEALLLDSLDKSGRYILQDISLPQRAIIKGDCSCLSIAAASIIAKVTRDRLMVQLHEQYPSYGFAQHKGYGTEAHLAALHEHGVTSIHRRTFAPVRELLEGGGKLPLSSLLHSNPYTVEPMNE
jgi:ribonuclease HII